jgi:hypothetical protein
MNATNATPPTTPPAIAPTLGLFDGGAGFGFGMQVMCAHVLQDCGTREQISPSAQVGQVGVSGGHFTQRANMVRSVCSTSAALLVLKKGPKAAWAVLREDMVPRTVMAIVMPYTSRGGV